MNNPKRGAAMVEFLAVFGILSFCAFGVIEFSKMLEASKNIVNLARETANAAKRDCASGPISSMQICLNNTAAKMEQVANAMLQQNNNDTPFTNHGYVRVIVWKDPNPGLGSRRDTPRGLGSYGQTLPGAPVMSFAGKNAVSRASAYQNVESMPDYQEFVDIYNNQTSVVVSEVYLEHNPITQFLAGLFSQPNGAKNVLYDTALF